ncbi:MAG: OsmC family protein [Bacteroidetes bacterium]|nr:OsmC family protein [Bacteroidota bacterium]
MKFHLRRSADGSHTIARDPMGNELQMYLPENAGGNATGIRPMQVLIMGLAGCTAVDVLLILKKQRQEVLDLHIDVEAERQPDVEPSLWEQVTVHFTVIGPVELAKAQRAVDLSMQKYCSVSETLRRAGADIHWTVETRAE